MEIPNASPTPEDTHDDSTSRPLRILHLEDNPQDREPSNLPRLPAALRAAMREVRERRRRRRTEQALRESEKSFRGIAGGIRDVFRISPSDARRPAYLILGYKWIRDRPVSGPRARPETWIGSVPREDRPRALAAFGTLDRGGYIHVEHHIARAYGEAADITERKQLQEQLLQAQKMEALGQLAGDVAHDFNNLLTVINGYAGLALGRKDVPDQILKPRQQAHSVGARAATPTRQPLVFGGKKEMRLVPVDLNAALEHTTSVLARLIWKHIRLGLDLSPRLPRVQAYTSMIEQLLVNLAVNDRDAMPADGRPTMLTEVVELDATAAHDRPRRRPGIFVRLSVADTGTSIPPELPPLVFEPFFTTKKPARAPASASPWSSASWPIIPAGGRSMPASARARPSIFSWPPTRPTTRRPSPPPRTSPRTSRHRPRTAARRYRWSRRRPPFASSTASDRAGNSRRKTPRSASSAPATTPARFRMVGSPLRSRRRTSAFCRNPPRPRCSAHPYPLRNRPSPQALRLALPCSSFCTFIALADKPLTGGNLGDLSLEELINETVTSVSKREHKRTAAAVAVLTNEEIRRSCFTSVAKALRHVDGSPIRVRLLDSGADRSSARIVYVAALAKSRLATSISGLPAALTVGEAAAFAAHGGVIRFTLVEEKVRFETDVGSAEKPVSNPAASRSSSPP